MEGKGAAEKNKERKGRLSGKVKKKGRITERNGEENDLH